MAKRTKPTGIYKTLERAAHETRYGIESVYFSFNLSKRLGPKKPHVLSGMPESTMAELLALRRELNKLLRPITKRDKKSDRLS